MKIYYKHKVFSLDVYSLSEHEKEILIDNEKYKIKVNFQKEISPSTSIYIIEYQNQDYKAIITESLDRVFINIEGKNFIFTKNKEEAKSVDIQYNIQEILAPLPGTLTKLYVKKEQTVKQGEVLLIIESMKMENQIVCPRDAVIEEVYVQEGQKVETNQLLLKLL